MQRPVTGAAGQLLENVHITKLKIVMWIYMVGKSKEKTVLVKTVIDYLFTKIDMYFIIQNE